MICGIKLLNILMQVTKALKKVDKNGRKLIFPSTEYPDMESYEVMYYILKKEARRRSYIQGTEGGPPPQIFLSSFEEEVLEFLTPEAAGLQNIPEGGIIETAEETQTLSECCSTSQINQFTSHDKVIEKQNILPHVEIDDNIENTPPNITKRKKNVNIPENNTRKEKSIHHLSYSMLQIQEMKLKLKRKEIKIRKKTLKVQENIMFELKEIKSILQIESASEFII
ncbi:uncharacterized protein LOC116850780 [Odontomachus brunneus]|uniref:uncharacterized protein LOC116850780 n=1 Tax=Odontomachus brunneus TaxID=486640 RepID=UPI0013F1F5C0|nr:uncharacterized protein LOC116850780 [Odontomachus brunneus]XP_032685317.1 uncharacterized protein LOC116850780 [Odontomachus brunneus]XP_032685318.1 uncharacterized protein LOC116850780 [Odontomachus brunneus]